MEIIKDDGVKGLVRLLAHMPQQQEAMLVATKVLAKTGFLERGVDTYLSRAPCVRADNKNFWMLKRLLELPDVEDEEPQAQAATTPTGTGRPVDRRRRARAGLYPLVW